MTWTFLRAAHIQVEIVLLFSTVMFPRTFMDEEDGLIRIEILLCTLNR